MAIKNRAETILEDNWDQIKDSLRSNWRKFKEKDLEEITNYKQLTKKLQEVYDFSADEIADKIDIFIDKMELTSGFTRLEELKEALYQSTAQAKTVLASSFEKSVNEIKKQLIDVKDATSQYVSENPMQSLGFGILAGMLLNKILAARSK